MLLLALCAAAAGFGGTRVLQAAPAPRADTARSDAAMYYLVPLAQRSDLDTLRTAGFLVTGASELAAEILADAEELPLLDSLGFSYTAQPAAAKAASGYTTYAELSSALAEIAEAAPEITRLDSLGQSVDRRELWALRITDRPETEEAEPEFKYVATMHGDEPVGTELCLDLIYSLVNGYGSDERITALIDNTDIWIVPLMNPDGYELQRRANRRGIDLNRNFPRYPEEIAGTYFGGAPLNDAGRQPETQHVMRWSASQSFVLSANMHTGALVVNYPYDDDEKPSGVASPSPDEELLRVLSLRYATPNPQLANSAEFPQGVTNGAAWYVAEGGMQDWNYRYLGCMEVTLELAVPKTPPANTLAQYWANNEESLLAYMESVNRFGVRGVIRDRATGGPLWAQVSIEGNAQPVFSDADVGDYYRLLLPGQYRLTAWREGYIAWRSDTITVAEGVPVTQDIALSNGDVNSDARVDVTDVQLVASAVLRSSTSNTYDVDGRGVAATDIQAVVNAALGR